MMDEDNFTGPKFLLDAVTKRQYVLQFKDGNIVPPLRIFPSGEKLKVGETVYALDDDQVTNKSNGPGWITTDAYQITAEPTDAYGEHYDIRLATVTFQLRKTADGRVTADLMPESKTDLIDEGFDKTFPQSFSRIDVPAAGGGYNLCLPPHQPGQAVTARASFKAPVPPKQQFNPPAAPPVKKNYKIPDAKLEDALAKFGRDLTAEARAGTLDPVVGRDEDADQALQVLNRRKQSSLCFTGEAGTGKTSMFYAVAQRIVDDSANLPEGLRDARVIQLDLQGMNAGASLRGQFEEKLKPIVDGLAERNGMINGKKIIIAIDELPTQLSAGAAQGTDNAGAMMKPFLTTQGVSVMGTTTDEEYKKNIEKDPALVRRFEKLRLDPPNEETTKAIMRKLWPLTKGHNHLTEDLTEDDLNYLVTMCKRYAPNEFSPSKEEKAMMMAASSAEFNHRDAITREDIIAAVAKMSGLKADFLAQSDGQRFLKLEEELPKEVMGQPGLIRITDGLIGSRSGLNDPNQPWGCFVLQGPTGTGKTETCKALARYLFGDEKSLIKLDMADYQQEFDVSKLTGAPPGYVGFEDAEPALTERIRQRPYSILLLDEIEKAHPKVFDKFLSILNDGKMVDNHGKTVLFNNVIVVMTTNAGANKVQDLLDKKDGMSFDTDTETTDAKLQEKMEKIYSEAVKAGTPNFGPFRPEMINRIEELGGFITFMPLARDVVANIAKRQIELVGQRLSNTDGSNLPGVTLEVSKEVMDQLAKEGYNPAMGARPLRKVVREKVANPLGKWVMLHREEIEAFVKKEGKATLVIDSIDNFAPKMVKTAPANDNKAAAKAPVRKAAATRKKKPAASGPT